jgi:protein O-mannosyl-transferase
MHLLPGSRRQQPPTDTRTGVAILITNRFSLVAALVLAAGVAAVYSPALNFQFILDDHRFAHDHRIQFSGYVWDYFTSFVWAQTTGAPPSFYRPIFLVWMRINFILCGLSPWGWHLLSVAKHLLVAVLLGYLVWVLLRDWAAALLASTLFALHPAQAESVAWVTVPDPLMSAAVLGCLLCYLKFSQRSRDNAGIRSPERRRKAPSRIHASSSSRLWLNAGAAMALIALFAKETAIIVPALIFAIAFRRLQADQATSADRRTEHRRVNLNLWTPFSGALRQSLPFLSVTVMYLLLRMNALGGTVSSRTQQLPLRTVLLSWPATLWFYAKVLFWPVRSRAFADPTLVQGFSGRAVLLPTLGLLILAAVLAGLLRWAWIESRRESSPNTRIGAQNALIIGTLLLILPILLTLNLNALNPGDFLHGRYTYLPLAGSALLLASMWHMLRSYRIPLLVGAAILAIAFSALTLSQERQWRDDLSVFTVAHELAPNNIAVSRNLADARVQQALLIDSDGKCSETMSLFQQVSREFPDDWYAWAAIGNCWMERDDLPEAEKAFHRAVDLSHDPNTTQAWLQLREQLGLPVAPAHVE